MTTYERAIECVPKDTWDEIIAQWKMRYPDISQYVRLNGGDNLTTQLWASELRARHIQFTWANSIPFLAAFGFGMFDDINESADLSVDDVDSTPTITFLSLPKNFKITTLSSFDEIELCKGVIYYNNVPVPVLEKMNELGKLFTK